MANPHITAWVMDGKPMPVLLAIGVSRLTLAALTTDELA